MYDCRWSPKQEIRKYWHFPFRNIWRFVCHLTMHSGEFMSAFSVEAGISVFRRPFDEEQSYTCGFVLTLRSETQWTMAVQQEWSRTLWSCDWYYYKNKQTKHECWSTLSKGRAKELKQVEVVEIEGGGGGVLKGRLTDKRMNIKPNTEEIKDQR